MLSGGSVLFTWKSKNHRSLIFVGERWNTDVYVADIVGGFEATWTCPFDLYLSRFISDPFKTHL
jgi:hypothetical protein